MRPIPTPDQLLTLEDEVWTVRILPAKGSDIFAIIDRITDIDILFKTPWGYTDPELTALTGDSQADWLARYPGGWNLLVPNAGPERRQGAHTFGYHGESAITAWEILERSQSEVTLGVDLRSAPLRLTRRVELKQGSIYLHDTVRNRNEIGPDDLANVSLGIPVMMVQHPAFGEPFVDQHSVIHSGARTVIADAHMPGNLLLADSVSEFPWAKTADGGHLDLRQVPAADTGTAVFAALTDFDECWFSIDSPSVGFGVRVEWSAVQLPHAWFWQECHANPEPPWLNQAYAIAVEPANVLPGEGFVQDRRRGGGTVLGPGEELETTLRLFRYSC